jgi:hypothetical protein
MTRERGRGSKKVKREKEENMGFIPPLSLVIRIILHL